MEYLYFKLYEDSNLYCITFWILCYVVIISFTLPLRLWSIQSVRDIHGQKTKFDARTEESLVTSFCEPDFQLENNPASDWPEIWPTIYRDWKASGMLLGRNLRVQGFPYFLPYTLPFTRKYTLPIGCFTRKYTVLIGCSRVSSAFSWYFTCMLYEFKHSYKR